MIQEVIKPWAYEVSIDYCLLHIEHDRTRHEDVVSPCDNITGSFKSWSKDVPIVGIV